MDRLSECLVQNVFVVFHIKQRCVLISSVPKPGGKDTLLFDSESRFLLNICLFCFVRGQRYIGYLGLHLVPAAYRTEYRNISTDKIVEWSELNHAFVRVI